MTETLTNINWNDFHFLRPDFLWLMIPALVALIIGLLGLRERIKWKSVIAPKLRPFMIKKGSERIKKWMHILLFLLISVAILGAAGPSWRKNELPEQILETPLVITLDLSQSMMADDIQPSRLERAKFKLLDLFEAKPGARTALVGFAGTAHTIVPLTRDYKIISSHLQSLSPDIIPYPGSDLRNGLILADSLCNDTSAPGTILIVTDDISDQTFSLLQSMSIDNKNRFVLMPMNTPGGAAIPAKRKGSTYKDSQGKPIISSIDNTIIQKIGSLENVEISTLTLDKSDVQILSKKISENLKFKEDEEEQEENWKDDGLWLSVPFAFLVLLWFRKGWVIYGLLIMTTLSSCGKKSEFVDLWVSKDYQAQTHYQNGEYSEAGSLYTDPLRKGIAFYKAGDYQQAIESFKKDSTAMGSYNLGLAYYQNGDYAAAAQAFDQAIQLDPELEEAKKSKQSAQNLIPGMDTMTTEEATEVPEEKQAQNIENKDTEDLGGGGQEATEEDMKKERKEETVGTDTRTGKEMEEVPDDFKSGKGDNSQKVLMRKVDDDPALFLKRKFKHQVKTDTLKPKANLSPW